MPIVKAKNNLDVYRIRAHADDIHELSGRRDKAATRWVNERIIRYLTPAPDDCTVDIGCGDGSLLSSLSGSIRCGIGVVPTPEEAARLQTERIGLVNVEFRTGLSSRVPCGDGIATKVICNGVFILLQDDEEVERSLREIYRISKPGAAIWIGEIPDVDENRFYGRTYGDSISRWLIYLLRKQGFRAFASGLCRVLRSSFGIETFIVAPKKLWSTAPERLIQAARGCGLQLVAYERHRMVDGNGQIVPSPTRYDYLFTK